MIPLGRVPTWIVALIVGREILVTSLRVVALREGMLIESSRMGKYKTVFQIVAIVSLLINYKYKFGVSSISFFVDFNRMGIVLLYIALIITVWTGADYFLKFYKKINNSLQ
jgi:CDP-diacylglycerol--glycerol-3-phosphate 3-phosphatidyltransferase